MPLACGLDPYDWCKQDWSKCIDHFNSRAFGCLFDSKAFYLSLWDEYLPVDAHIRVSGRLFISITQVPAMKNVVVSHFESREKLLQSLVASMCLPIVFIIDFPIFVSGLGYCIDGGFSNDAPCVDSYTVTVSALHHEADVKPAKGPLDKPVQWTKWLKWSQTYASLNDLHEDAFRKEDDHQSLLKSDQNSDKYSNTSSSEYYNDDGSIDYDHQSRIRAIDIIRVPDYSRVWQVGAMGERAAARCKDFERHEWQSVKLKAALCVPSGSGTGSGTGSSSSSVAESDIKKER